ncbi:ATP-dependent DNA helicase [Heracleum sosnowskyi]|uniref:ATP-dependent DNA helicase n=1 Tax=Heracleum sosnowskyi TaxID=360622 RepID=A0AAD8MP97_9APIA|nr:ATP-dependent DNA helicase [Heracleum sosnowskyi]
MKINFLLIIQYTLCCRLRSQGQIVLPVASSGIAATLLPGGRTAYSRFHIPLKLDHISIVGIKHGTDITELMQHTNLIIWDEAPMQHRHAFESVDRCLRDIMSAIDPSRSKQPFGSITVIFGGDFCQILPVIPKGSRAQILSASLNQTKLCHQCQVFLLRQNMRLSGGKSAEDLRQIEEFSRWVLDVGNGELPNIGPDDATSDPQVLIPDKFLIKSSSVAIKDIFDVVYPDFQSNMSFDTYLRQRSILAPTNAVVGDINDYILDLIPRDSHTYYNQDSLAEDFSTGNDFQSAFPVEYINSINMPCLPKHELKLKVGSVVILMRNLNQIMGLCNGTRMIVKKCLKNSIICQTLCG